MKKTFWIVLSFFYSLKAYPQIIYGFNNYTEYHTGSLPVVISVPHGGSLTPLTIPDRTCNNAVNVTDANTIQLAQQIDSAFVLATGCHPYIIYCNLKRSKLDCNRNIADGACGNAIAENAWNEFNNFINTAQDSANSQFTGKVLYIDLHGHGNSIQRLELGYLLYDYELAYTDSILNTSQYVGYSTIQNLVSTNINGFSHAELLRGNFALGTLLGNAGYPSVPSSQIPFPGTTTNYFSGGYNVANHTCYTPNNNVNGLQMECNFTNVRDSYLNRKLFATSLVSAIGQYCSIHHNINFTNCVSSSIPESTVDKHQMIVSPNPAATTIHFKLAKNITDFEIELINLFGQTVLKTKNQYSLNIQPFPKGIYFVKLLNDKNQFCKKIIIE